MFLWAGSHELITGLLEKLFTTDEVYSDILRNRCQNQSAYLTIESVMFMFDVAAGCLTDILNSHGLSTSLVNVTLSIPGSNNPPSPSDSPKFHLSPPILPSQKHSSKETCRSSSVPLLAHVFIASLQAPDETPSPGKCRFVSSHNLE
ncbi:hypothetical protein CY34DRAFT_19644 [Suillus luteus UH-Slu-Lm8-n1]|uniref:Uncharacterized protein n=1 Tax=Suillus luteus UH-Slu-Lm8-n1 TaxID=930992 RepID=A0A0D0ABS2_9AGAM|nr:hypothetical protein CY34DRAFT_19644 [Suillus luteus UH-Slu-Lm8-n1]